MNTDPWPYDHTHRSDKPVTFIHDFMPISWGVCVVVIMIVAMGYLIYRGVPANLFVGPTKAKTDQAQEFMYTCHGITKRVLYCVKMEDEDGQPTASK